MKPYLWTSAAASLLLVEGIKLRGPTDQKLSTLGIDESTLGAMFISDMASKDSVFEEAE